ncbi:MAG TPA: PQQ-dependent sugar dehydrogenase, partial [Planctomycetota bacterium]
MRSFLLALTGLVAVVAPLSAQDLPPGFVAEPIDRDWQVPLKAVFLEPGRMLVAEKAGKVWYVENDVRKNLVVDLPLETLNNGDRGLLGIAADPQFASNGLLYLLLVVDPNGDGIDSEQESYGRLVRYGTYTDAQGNLLADHATRTVLLGDTWSTGIPSCHLSHAVGSVLFLSDGSLIVTAGDGAHYDGMDVGGRDPGCFGAGRFTTDQDLGAFRSQYLDTLAGKILRIDPGTGLGLPDNPFYNGDPAAWRSRVWALGLRNPYRVNVLPGTGPRETLLVGDVGWETWEEVNLCRGGENFGWPCYEGDGVQPQYSANDPHGLCGAAGLGHVKPLITWHHNDPGSIGFAGHCASGVAAYETGEWPPLYHDRVFFCDFERGWLRSVRLDALGQVVDIQLFGERMGPILDLVRDPGNGDLIYTTLEAVRRIRYFGDDQSPVAVASADPAWGGVPLTVNLKGSDSYDPEQGALLYHWDLGDGTTSGAADLVKVYPQVQPYLAVLTVTDPQLRSSQASVLITPGNTPPAIQRVQMPVDGGRFRFGIPVRLDASATDLEDAAAGIPLQAQWRVDRVHDHHVHPRWDLLTGLTGDFNPPEFEAGSWYRLTLEVADSMGLMASESVVIYDSQDQARAHLTEIDDPRPRRGQLVHGRGHLEWPGSFPGVATLTWDWGDGTVVSFPGMSHWQDVEVEHRYATDGAHNVQLTVQAGSRTHIESFPVDVQKPRAAVAVFAPLVHQ